MTDEYDNIDLLTLHRDLACRETTKNWTCTLKTTDPRKPSRPISMKIQSSDWKNVLVEQLLSDSYEID